MFIKELSGHSGCKLGLHKEDERFFVRKMAGGADYNERLRKQCAKQKRFLSSAQLAAPEILGQGFIDENFYFDMAFIQGNNMIEHFSYISTHDTTEYIKILFQSLSLETSETASSAQNIFQEKIEQLKATTKDHAQAQNAIHMLRDFDWSSVSKSPCHGDLTLENILITPQKEIYLIDFLDSFYNSWMIDVAKLLQDLELGWSFRHQKNDTTRNLKLLVAKEALFDEIRKMDNAEYITSAIHHLLLLNIVRIYPYTKDDATLRFLDIAVENVTAILEKSSVPKRMVVNE